jgi:virginiamycin B lyase
MQIAVFRPTTAEWFIRLPNGGTLKLSNFGAVTNGPTYQDLPAFGASVPKLPYPSTPAQYSTFRPSSSPGENPGEGTMAKTDRTKFHPAVEGLEGLTLLALPVTAFPLPFPAMDLRIETSLAGSDGNLWVVRNAVGSRTKELVRVSKDGGVTRFPLSSIRDATPALDGEGNLWVTGDETAWPFRGVTPASRSVLHRFSPDGTETTFPFPWGEFVSSSLTTGPDGNIYYVEGYGLQPPDDPSMPRTEPVSDYVAVPEYRIARMKPTGELTYFPLPDDAAMTGMNGGKLTFDREGAIWVPGGLKDPNNHTQKVIVGSYVFRVTTDASQKEGVAAKAFPVPDQGQPSWLTPDPAGNMWFVDAFENRLGHVSPDGEITYVPLGETDGVRNTFSGMQTQNGLTRAADGSLWGVERAAVFRISTHGELQMFPYPDASSLDPLTATPNGLVWAVLRDSTDKRARIVSFNPKGEVTTLDGPGDAGWNASRISRDLAVGPDGNLWFLDYDANTLNRLDLNPESKVETRSLITDPNAPSGASPVPIPSPTPTLGTDSSRSETSLAPRWWRHVGRWGHLVPGFRFHGALRRWHLASLASNPSFAGVGSRGLPRPVERALAARAARWSQSTTVNEHPISPTPRGFRAWRALALAHQTKPTRP